MFSASVSSSRRKDLKRYSNRGYVRKERIINDKKTPPTGLVASRLVGISYLALLLSEEFRFGMYDEGADRFAAFARLGFMVFPVCLDAASMGSHSRPTKTRRAGMVSRGMAIA